MRATASISASFDFDPARPAFKGLQLVCAPMERMWRAPYHLHCPGAGRASRPFMRTKADLHRHDIESSNAIQITPLRIPEGTSPRFGLPCPVLSEQYCSLFFNEGKSVAKKHMPTPLIFRTEQY